MTLYITIKSGYSVKTFWHISVYLFSTSKSECIDSIKSKVWFDCVSNILNSDTLFTLWMCSISVIRQSLLNISLISFSDSSLTLKSRSESTLDKPEGYDPNTYSILFDPITWSSIYSL